MLHVIGTRLHAMRVIDKMLNVTFDINIHQSNTQQYNNGL